MPNFEIGNIIEGITNSISTDEDFLDYSKKQFERLEQRLAVLIETHNTLNTISKASDLLLEYENVFSNARIITDIRPIFKPNIDKGLAGALIVHTLKIEYRDVTGTKELYLTLDALDLFGLSEELFRAEEKAQILQSLLKQVNLPHLDRYPTQEEEIE